MYPDNKLVAELVATEAKNLRSTSNLIPEAQAFLQWAATKGAKVPKENWVTRTIRGFTKVKYADDADIMRVYEKEFPITGELQYSLADLVHLGHIKDYIGDQNPKLLASKLTDIVRGPDSLLKETNTNNLSRNTRFELYVVEHLTRMDMKHC